MLLESHLSRSNSCHEVWAFEDTTCYEMPSLTECSAIKFYLSQVTLIFSVCACLTEHLEVRGLSYLISLVLPDEYIFRLKVWKARILGNHWGKEHGSTQILCIKSLWEVGFRVAVITLVFIIEIWNRTVSYFEINNIIVII